MAGFKVEIDGKEYRLPEDLDLNDAVEAERQELGPMESVRFMVWRVMLRDNPDITLEQAGEKIPLTMLLEDEAEEEGPPPVPLPEPEALSGMSSGDGSGNGSTEATVTLQTRGISGPR